MAVGGTKSTQNTQLAAYVEQPTFLITFELQAF